MPTPVKEFGEPSERAPQAVPDACFRHAETVAEYFCRSCQTWRCRDCVGRYGGVGVCPDCDALCLKASEVAAQASEPPPRDFEEDVRYAAAFPRRRRWLTVATALGVWMVACTMDYLMRITSRDHSGRFLSISLADLHPLAPVLTLTLLTAFAAGYLVQAANGRERWALSAVLEFSELFTPAMKSLTGLAIALFPIAAYFGQFVVAIFASNSTSDDFLRFSIFHHFGTVVFCAWALALLPTQITLTALDAPWLDLFSPFAWWTTMRRLRPWVVVACKWSAGAWGVVFVGGALVFRLPYGALPVALLSAAAALTTAAVFGTAVKHGRNAAAAGNAD